MRKVRLAVLGGSLVAVVVIGVAFRPKPGEGAEDVRMPAVDAVLLSQAATEGKGASAAELRRLRAADKKDEAALARAVAVAKKSVALSRKTGDPRHLGHAEAALAPWWSDGDAPEEVLVLRATIRQSRHDFELALADLDRALTLRPDDAQALLTRAVVLTVRADYTRAMESCDAARKLVPELVYEGCAGGVLGTTGKAREAIARIDASLARPARLPKDLVAWAVGIVGELRARIGEIAAAEADYKRSLDLDPGDPYVLGAYADLLLDAGRPREVVPLLSAHEANDGLLLRLVLAMTQAGSADAARAKAELAGRYAASRARGDVVHRREESRWALAMESDPRRALDLARANWDVQKEPADARVLLEAARGAKDPTAAAPVFAWLDSTAIEDVVLRRLQSEIRGPK